MSVAPSFQDGKAPADPDKKQAPLRIRRGPRPGQGRRAADPARPRARPARRSRSRRTGRKPTRTRSRPSRSIKNLKGIKDLVDLKQALAGEQGRTQPYLPPVESSSLKTLFLGGGAYCFQRHMKHAYPGTGVDVAEIDPAVTNANMMATGLADQRARRSKNHTTGAMPGSSSS